MPTSVVTGGAGFLGSHLCDRLLAEGHRVICVDNLDTGSLQNIESAEAAGDSFPTRPSLAWNGLGTVAAAESLTCGEDLDLVTPCGQLVDDARPDDTGWRRVRLEVRGDDNEPHSVVSSTKR